MITDFLKDLTKKKCCKGLAEPQVHRKEIDVKTSI